MTVRYADLFAGIGGFRIAFDEAGAECVFSSEIDSHAADMYQANFGERPSGDITKIRAENIPAHDILTAGFPCQPFSSAGQGAGFGDPRGTMFWEILRVLKYHRPIVVVLENVSRLSTHDGGRTMRTILSELVELGYTVSWKVLNASDFSVPQNRARTIIVASMGDAEFDFDALRRGKRACVADALEPVSDDTVLLDESEYTILDGAWTVQRSGLVFAGYKNGTLRKAGARPGTSHLSRVHRQPNRIYSADGVHPTISSSETAGRYYVIHESLVRKLSVAEVYRVMGFPDSFVRIGSDGQQLARAGNAVAVPMVRELAREVFAQFFANSI